MSAITARARAYVRSRAKNEMSSQCRIERVSRPTYDETTLKSTAPSRVTIYEGVCRVWEITGGTTLNLGEADVEIKSTQLSTPYDAPIARRNDEVVILGTDGDDDSLVGRRLQIQSNALAGELRATRRYEVTVMG